MANANKPMGLSPHSYLNGSMWNGQATMYWISSDDTNAFAIGDPVTLTGTGDANGVAGITLATAGTANVILGALVSYGGQTYGGAPVDPANLDTTVIPATKTKSYYVLVADDAQIIFEAQEDSVGANLAKTDIGTNVNLVAGTNNGYVSGWMIDSSPTATTATLQCQLLRKVQRADNAIGQYCKWLVRINNHQFKAGVAGV